MGDTVVIIFYLDFELLGILCYGAQLTCAIRNILQPQTTYFIFYFSYKLDDFLLSVHPRISLKPGPRYAMQGSTFTLPTCHVTEYPTPVVTWRKSSRHLPQGRVRYNNSVYKFHKFAKKTWICTPAQQKTLQEKLETMLVVVSLPRFTSKPPSKIVSILNSRTAVRLNCRATGDPQPIISWRKQVGQLPVGRSQRIN